jgi:hypothetical protein
MASLFNVHPKSGLRVSCLRKRDKYIAVEMQLYVVKCCPITAALLAVYYFVLCAEQRAWVVQQIPADGFVHAAF